MRFSLSSVASSSADSLQGVSGAESGDTLSLLSVSALCVNVCVGGMGSRQGVSVRPAVIRARVCVCLGVCVLRASRAYLSGEEGDLVADLCDSPIT